MRSKSKLEELERLLVLDWCCWIASISLHVRDVAQRCNHSAVSLALNYAAGGLFCIVKDRS